LRLPAARLERAPFLLLAIVSLGLGLAGGLARMGHGAALVPLGAITAHGPLMLVGFLATLIGVERAVGLGRPWAYVAPAGTELGALAAALAPGPSPLGPGLAAAGTVVFAAVMGAGLWRFRTPALAVQAAGALALAAGTVAWAAGAPVFRVVPAWTAFLVLTIAGERLELSRVAMPPRAARHILAGLAGALLAVAAAPAASAVWPDPAARLLGALWLATAFWLVRYDLARRSLRRPGLPRFMAVSLLSGYGWLAVGGALALGGGLPPAGLHADAVLHAFFLGFVFSMIFGHAPVIFPGVLGLPVGTLRFSRGFYGHLLLLHAGLALRMAGDLAGDPGLRLAGGMTNVVAIVLFFVQTAVAGTAAARRPVPGAAGSAAPTPPGP